MSAAQEHILEDSMFTPISPRLQMGAAHMPRATVAPQSTCTRSDGPWMSEVASVALLPQTTLPERQPRIRQPLRRLNSREYGRPSAAEAPSHPPFVFRNHLVSRAHARGVGAAHPCALRRHKSARCPCCV